MNRSSRLVLSCILSMSEKSVWHSEGKTQKHVDRLPFEQPRCLNCVDVFLEKAFWEHGKTRDYKIYRKELGDDLGTILLLVCGIRGY